MEIGATQTEPYLALCHTRCQGDSGYCRVSLPSERPYQFLLFLRKLTEDGGNLAKKNC